VVVLFVSALAISSVPASAAASGSFSSAERTTFACDKLLTKLQMAGDNIYEKNDPALLRLWADVGAYVGTDNDPWINESWVVISGTSSAPTSFNLYIDSMNYASENLYLAVAVDDPARVENITIGSITITSTSFTYGTVTWPAAAGGGELPKHGVYPTWYALVPIGDVDANWGYQTIPGDPYGPYWAYRKNVPVTITASATIDNGFKVHFDAHGILEEKPDVSVSSPFSHDVTVVVPIGAIGALLVPLLMLLPFVLILRRQNRR
jgi:hypothetical protein